MTKKTFRNRLLTIVMVVAMITGTIGTSVAFAADTVNWTWAADYSSAFVTINGTMQGATVTSQTVEPTCEEDGYTVYTATATAGSKTYSTSQTVEGEKATGHDTENMEVSWSWSENYSRADAKLTCPVCGEVVDTVEADVKTNEVEATCTEDGYTVYTATATYEDENYTSQVKVAGDSKTGHSYDEPAWTWAADYSTATAKFTCTEGDSEITVNADITVESTGATCTEGGTVSYTATVTGPDGKTYTSGMEVNSEEALGHSWTVEQWSWGENYGSATLTLICGVCGETSEAMNAGVTSSEEVEATCEEDGYTTYTASVVYNDVTHTDTKTVVTGDATGHNYAIDDDSWDWADDCSWATATFVCKNDDTHTVTVEAEIAETETTKATCEEDGTATYTATATLYNEKGETVATGTATKTITTDKATGHDYVVSWTFEADDLNDAAAALICVNCGDEIKGSVETDSDEVTVEATCTTDGYTVTTYTATAAFTVGEDDDAETITETITKTVVTEGDKASGHKYAISWKWSEDGSSATATIICINEGCDYTATENAEVTTDSITAGCETPGEIVYSASITIDGVDYSDVYKVSVAKLGHDYQLESWEWGMDYATATATFKCANCGEEITPGVTVNTPNAADGTHKDAACEETGYDTYIATCTYGDWTYTYTETVEIPAIGHDYSFVGFTWTETEDGYTAVANLECRNDEEHTSEVEAEVEVTEATATCTEDGETTYTASAEVNGATYIDTKTVDTEATGHNYSVTGWDWADDYSSATATLVCADCGNEEVVEATVTSEETDPICEEDGYTTYTATVTYEGVEYTATEVATDVGSATGHNYSVTGWDWADDYSSATATLVCADCGNEEVVEATVTSEETDPTCEEDGYTTYTATVTYEGVEYTATEVATNVATGHKYSVTGWDWADDYSSATATLVCANCGNEEAVKATVTSEETAPTCEEDGYITYTATATYEGVEYTATEVATNVATGHNYSVTGWDWADDYSSATATLVCADCGNEEIVEATVTSSQDGYTITYTATVAETGFSDTKAVNTQVYAEDVALNTTSIEIPTLGTYQLTATVDPANVSDASVVWTSSDESVATVDQNGVVTAVTYGTAVITATSADGKASASCTVQTRFWDVTEENVKASVYEAVYWAADNGYVNGFSGGVYFGPEQSVTREQIVIMLYRLAGSPEISDSAATVFSDYGDIKSATGRTAIAWAVSEGIVKGYSNGSFKPQSYVTREEITIMLYRYAGEPEVNSTASSFKDASDIKSKTGKTAIAWAVEEGIVKGFSNGSFKPQDNALRQQFVIMLQRFIG